MALTDELNSCTLPEGYPTGLKLVPRPQSFCDEVSLSKTLSVEGTSTLNSSLTVSGDTSLQKVDAAGDLSVGGSVSVGTGFQVELQVGSMAASTPYIFPLALPTSNGQVLASSRSGSLSWVDAGGSDYVDPLTTVGDLLVRDADNVTARFPIGTTDQYLVVQNGGLPGWQDLPAFLQDPTTTRGDLLVRNNQGVTRLGVGNAGEVLTVRNNGQDLEWAPTSGGPGSVSSVNGQAGAVVLVSDDIGDSTSVKKFATANQLNLIGTALQPSDNVSELTNDAGYITAAQADVQSVNGQTGAVVLDADDIDDSTTTHKFATAAQLTLANNSIQPGDNISALTNDSNFITSAGAPVQSVAGKTGAVSLVKGDVGLGSVDNTTDLNKPISTATQTALNSKADLVGGKVPTSQLPALAITEYLGAVASQSAMLALTGERGDWCIRTDLGSTFVLVADGGSSLSDWQELATPASPVSSVNGQTGAVVLGAADVGAATTAQGAKADSATQPGDNISTLTNDSGYITAAQVPADAVSSVNTQTGTVVLDADDIDDSATTNKFVTQAELSSIASATQPGDNVSTLTNDAGYITSASVPVDSVNGQIGTVVLDAGDVGAATTAQGALADSATQPGDNVSTLTNDAGYITSASVPVDSVNGQTGTVVLDADDISDATTVNKFVDSAQIGLIASATQPGDAVSTLTNDAGYITLAQVPADAVSSVNTQTGAVVLDADDIDDSTTTHKFATASQLSLADSSVQPADNVSDLTNDAGYITLAQVPADAVSSVNTQTGAVVLDADDIDDSTTTHKFATASQLSLADSSVQPGDNVSDLTNDANYITSAGAPVQSVNTQTGTVVLDADDIDDAATTHKFATAAQLSNADSATQPGDNVSTLTNDAGYITLAQVPADAVSSVNSQTGVVVLDADDIDDSATTHKFVSQSELNSIASATQPGDGVSTLTNDANYITLAQVPADAVSSVNTQTGAVVLDADDIDDSATTHKFATASQLSKADSATQPGDNVSTLTNDANYITSAGAPVQSVAGKTGTVTLVKGDVGLGNVDNTTDLNKPISTATQTALDAKADLVGGKVPTTQLPSLAITEYLGQVASQAAMLALTGERGDWCIRTDLGSTFILVSDGGSSLSDWQELATPASPVSSVNGQTGAVVLGPSDVGAATTAQGTLADSATQPGDNVSTLTNDAGFITVASVPVDSVNAQTGVVVLDADDISDSATTNKFATTSQLNKADSALQSGDNISLLNNDSGYITGVGSENLEDLNDVTITSAGTGDFLQWNGLAWVNADAMDNGSF